MVHVLLALNEDGPPLAACAWLQIALKVADIGHLAGVLDVHKRWVSVVGG